MSSLAVYKALVTEKLGTSSTSFHTDQARTDAINEAISDICNSYDIPAMFIRSTLTFSSGLAAIPSNFFRMVKVWDPTTETNEFTYITTDLFDGLSSTDGNYWTIDYDISSSTRKFNVLPTATTTVNVRYVKRPTVLVSSSDESGLPIDWDDAVAYGAAAILANNAKDFNKMKSMEVQAEKMASRAYGATKNVGGVKGYSRLRSAYEKYSILDGNHPN